MTEGGPPRLDDLARRLRRLREQARPEDEGRKDRGPAPRASSFAMRVGIELVAGLVVGGGLGYFLDRWLGTSPFLLILFFFLGAAAGVLNIYRGARRMYGDGGGEGKDGAGSG
jgi:ATP synthase protein I